MEEYAKRYVRIGAPDKDKLAELVLKAMGPSRNQTEFAKELEVNPSTLSRIINKKNVGASSDELILAIAAHADPMSGITEEMLMKAHGMVIEVDERGRIGQSRYFMEKYTENVISAIASAILEQGASIEAADRDIRYRIVKGVGMMVDVLYKTSAVPDEGFWAFDVLRPRLSQRAVAGAGYRGVEYDRYRDFAMISRNIFDRIGRVLALKYSTIEMEAPIPNKFSFVITDKETYAHFSEIYKEFSAPMKLSFVYLNLETGRVTEEFNFIYNGKRDESFFKMIERKKSSDDDFEDGQFFFFFDDNEEDD
jgi:hypothetical protein